MGVFLSHPPSLCFHIHDVNTATFFLETRVKLSFRLKKVWEYFSDLILSILTKKERKTYGIVFFIRQVNVSRHQKYS